MGFVVMSHFPDESDWNGRRASLPSAFLKVSNIPAFLSAGVSAKYVRIELPQFGEPVADRDGLKAREGLPNLLLIHFAAPDVARILRGTAGSRTGWSS